MCWSSAGWSEAAVYIQELFIYFHVKLVDGSSLVLSLGRLFDELENSYSWQRRIRKCCSLYRNVRLLVAATKQSATPFGMQFQTGTHWAPFRNGKHCTASTALGGNDRRRAPVPKPPSATKLLLQKAKSPSGETAAEKTLMRKRRGKALHEPRGQRFQPKRRSHRVHAFHK